jgi:hypothetical protein
MPSLEYDVQFYVYTNCSYCFCYYSATTTATTTNNNNSNTKKEKSCGFSPQASSTDRATAACRRTLSNYEQ